MLSGTGETVRCRHCGMLHQGNCPRIKAIDYHAHGGVKRIEYWGLHEINQAGNHATSAQQAAAAPGVAAGPKEPG